MEEEQMNIGEAFLLAIVFVLALIVAAALIIMVIPILAILFIGAIIYIIIDWIFDIFSSSKCKFIGKCPWYDKEAVVCNQQGGDYYAGRPAGCWNIMQENGGKAPVKRYDIFYNGKRIEGIRLVTDYYCNEEELKKRFGKGYIIKRLKDKGK